MATVSFRLRDTNDNTIKESYSLRAIWWYIKTTINNARSYHIEELDGGEFIGVVSAYYLVENYKEEEDLPLTVTDIF